MKFSSVLSVLAMICVSGVAAAQSGGDYSSNAGMIAIGSALAIGLSAIGATFGQGRAAGSALEGIARNPGSKDQVFVPLLLSLAFIEFPALLGFLVAFLWYSSRQ
ncbi:MAG: ATP synthase F0 subunit C [Proteobacteria bacterium]|nr:ATP synthase F0 subunit C [Pseudomonadota bacterium]